MLINFNSGEKPQGAVAGPLEPWQGSAARRVHSKPTHFTAFHCMSLHFKGYFTSFQEVLASNRFHLMTEPLCHDIT